MSEYNKYLEHVYSDELIPEYLNEVDEVNQLMAQEGYHEWSEALERELDEQAWYGSKQINGILIKKACEHSGCPHTYCVKSLRLGGIEI